MKLKINIRYTMENGNGLIIRSHASDSSPLRYHVVEIIEILGSCQRVSHTTMTPVEIKRALNITDKKRLEVV